MPQTVEELGRAAKRKRPGVYDDIGDAELGRAIKRKFPGAYDDFTDVAPAPQQQPEGVFSSFQTGVAGPLLRNVLNTAADLYNRPGETLERAGRGALEFISAFDPAGAAYEPTVASQEPRLRELRARAAADRPEVLQSIERGMQIEEAKPRTRGGRIAGAIGSVLGEVAFPTAPESAVQNLALAPFAGAAVSTLRKVAAPILRRIRGVAGKEAAVEAEKAIQEAVDSTGEASPTVQRAVSQFEQDVAEINAMNASRGQKRQAIEEAIYKFRKESGEIPGVSEGARRGYPGPMVMPENPNPWQVAGRLPEAPPGSTVIQGEQAAMRGPAGIAPMEGPPPLEAELGAPRFGVREAPEPSYTETAGPRVGEAYGMEAQYGATPGSVPPADINAPWEPPWAREPRPQGIFPQAPVEFTGVERFAGDPVQQALFDAAANSKWQDTVLAYYRANLLTNPVGRASDLGGTIINQFADAAARPIAAAVDTIVSKLTGARSITGPSLRGTGRAFGSLGQGLKEAGQVLKTGRQAIESGAGSAYSGEIRSGLGKAVDVPVNGVFRVLGALDAPFRRFGFARNLYDRAKVAAINEGKRNPELVPRIRELLDDPNIIRAAIADGERAVLSEPNKISSWLASQTHASPNARLAIGLVQPFMRIPLNAVLKAADFSGLGGVKAMYKIARGVGRKATGQRFFRDLEDQRVFSQNVAAGSFAPAAFILGMELEERGKMNGYFYTSKKDYPNGKTPTSVNIGGQNYDINRLGGFIAAPLFVGATYNRLRKQNVDKADALLRSFSGLVQTAPALGYYGVPAKAGRILTSEQPGGEVLKEAGGTASGFIPASGAVRAVSRYYNPPSAPTRRHKRNPASR